MSEFCDCCGNVVTVINETNGEKLRLLHHFHQSKKGRTWIICLACAWLCMHKIGKSRHPEHYWKGSWNAGWFKYDIDELIHMVK